MKNNYDSTIRRCRGQGVSIATALRATETLVTFLRKTIPESTMIASIYAR